MKLVKLTENRYINPEFVTAVSIDFYGSDGDCAVVVNLSDGNGFYVASGLTQDEAEKLLQETVDKLTEAQS